MAQGHKTCYGTMFHETLHTTVDTEMAGKVFSVKFSPKGLARPEPSIKTDIVNWDDCLVCTEFEHCYKLCMAKLALETAIS